jgi:hypothetical protein
MCTRLFKNSYFHSVKVSLGLKDIARLSSVEISKVKLGNTEEVVSQ